MAKGNSGALFKHYRHGSRVQISDEKFGKGIYYTDAPLDEGFLKMLVNYDFKDEGEVLYPRPGLRNTGQDIVSSALNFDSAMHISDIITCPESDLRNYTQIILGKAGASKFTYGGAETKLYKGDGWVGTGIDSTLRYASMIAVDNKQVLFRKPVGAEIHRMPLTSLDFIAQQVGCFAYNNDYYFFKEDGNLYKSKFTPDATPATNPGVYSSELVTPRALTPKEAASWGYNMLSATPYVFSDIHNAADMEFLGVIPYKGNDIMMSPRTNETYTLRAYFSALDTDKYTIEWDWKETSADTWMPIKNDEDITLAANTTLTALFTSPYKSVLIRLTATKWVGGVKNTYPTQVITVGMTYDRDQQQTNANLTPKTYSLCTATGLAFWKQRLVVWGVKEDATILFLSDVNAPEYFPYPQAIEIFTEPIVHAAPFLNDLLVWTTSELSLLSFNGDGSGITRKIIQKNLSLKEWDTHLVQQVKNMVFFCSGPYYYMVVPSKNILGGLVIAPISKPLEELFNNFSTEVSKIINFVYNEDVPLELVHYYNYLDFEDVVNTYVFKVGTDLYLNFALLYNVTLRSWRAHIYESQHIYKPFRQDATKRGAMASLLKFNNRPAVQYLEFSPTMVADYYVPFGLTDLNNAETTFDTVHKYKNYQAIDSGLREHDSDFKRRFREFQLKFNNVSQQALNFYTDFYIDGALRKSMFQYEVVHEVDPQSPAYGTLTISRTLVDPTVLPGATVLAADESETNQWQLDVSTFPDVLFWKVRIPVSGKGYTPRLRLVSYNEERYELLNLSWVFRPLYSR